MNLLKSLQNLFKSQGQLDLEEHEKWLDREVERVAPYPRQFDCGDHWLKVYKDGIAIRIEKKPQFILGQNDAKDLNK